MRHIQNPVYYSGILKSSSDILSHIVVYVEPCAVLQIVASHQSLPTIWVSWSVKTDADFLK